MVEDKNILSEIFHNQFKKVIQKLDPTGFKTNKEFAYDIGISESLFSKYYNKPTLPDTYEYILISNYFKKHIPNFNENFLVDNSESMLKENSVIVKTFRANEDLSVALYELKEYHNILTSIFENSLTKHFLQNSTILCDDIENNIINLVADWEHTDKKHKTDMIFLIKEYLNNFDYNSLQIKMFPDLKNILFKLALDTIINTLKHIITKETETHKNLTGNNNIKDMYNFLIENYVNILDLSNF